MKKLVILCLAAGLFVGCGIHKKYERPEMNMDGLYGDAEGTEGSTLGDLRWEELFTDAHLTALIEKMLEQNTDLQAAHLKITEAQAALQSARLAFLPSINLAPQGSLSSFNHATPTKTYTLPVTASWQFDLLMGGLANTKRQIGRAHV